MKALAAVLVLVLAFAISCESISGPVDDEGRAVNPAQECYPDASPC